MLEIHGQKCKICEKEYVHLRDHIRNVHEKDMEIPSWLEEKMTKRKEKLEMWDRFVTEIVKNDDETRDPIIYFFDGKT